MKHGVNLRYSIDRYKLNLSRSHMIKIYDQGTNNCNWNDKFNEDKNQILPKSLTKHRFT